MQIHKIQENSHINNICCLLLCQPTKFCDFILVMSCSHLFLYCSEEKRKRKESNNSLVPISYSERH